MDRDGYPDDQELDRIRAWPAEDPHGLLEFIRSLWRYPEFVRVSYPHGLPADLGRPRYHLSTGGWSGNESIIGALEANQVFWSMCWFSSQRGGHYEFDLPKVKKRPVMEGQ
jgi:hypothetical protein